MNCREFQDLVSAAVDLQLTGPEQEAFTAHSLVCSSCRKEYEFEAATKRFIISRLRRVETPPGLALRISELVDGDRPEAGTSWVTTQLRKPLVKPALGFAFAFALVLFLLRGTPGDRSGTQPALVENDVIVQSLRNHRAVLEGEIKPQVTSSEPELASLFSGITDYSVHLPKMKNCRLIGGVQNEFAGTKIAQVVYKRDTDIVYIYQTCWATVRKGEKLTLPEEVKAELSRTGHFVRSEPDGRSVVLWVKGRTLCAAVSQMPQQDLVSCLEFDESNPGNW